MRRSGLSAHDRRPHMARTVASLPAGSRITDYISLGVLTKTFPLDKVMAVVAAAGKTNQRQRDLPAHVVVYYVIALTLYMQVSYREVLRCLLEGVKWLLGPEWEVKVAGKSGISQARTRLGWEPLQQLHDQVVAPIAVQRTKGAWVSALAFGQFGWQHPGGRRQPGQRESLRTAERQSGDQRLPASALRVLGGKRDARIVRHANERLWRWGNHAGPQGITRAQTGNVVSGRSQLLWV